MVIDSFLKPRIAVVRQSILLKKLYDLLCESCRYQYFSGYDTFDSIGIEQSAFCQSVITLRQEAEGKLDTLKELIAMIIKNSVNRHSLNTFFMHPFIQTLEAPDLKVKAIEYLEKLIAHTKSLSPKGIMGSSYSSYSSSMAEYTRKERINDCAIFGYYLYEGLQETNSGIAFFQKYYKEEGRNGAEIKLYVLVRTLFGKRKQDAIVREIDKAIEEGVKPRESLRNLSDEIKKTGKLPNYMR